ncbi:MULTISPECIES: M13 family metallopeptidase [Shewanella]|uniref:M13 family peptidase n=2 Tax=Unclassified Bacteria TaxID=49928 RepID=A0AAU6VQN9_UNCXX|nr:MULTISPECIES: M13-type metalloendopeptidase [Shewanella]MBO2699079.1 M13 family peptidase [Shewanella algae]MCT8979717.1 M13 family peptidase [Shewanella algae]MDE0566262.1 M13 family peptidase [Shewanella sp. K8]MDO8255699.1 M13-type metalloendopeptidase [Shewanella algae]TVL00495.1 peptidase M13 [Shewanella algae]
MSKISTLALGIALSLGLASCASQQAPQSQVEVKKASGIELENFDHQVRHQDDFYYSVNGKWLATTPIPADKSNYGAFSVLYEESQAALKQIIEEAAAKPNKAEGSVEQKIGDFYAAYMDSTLTDQLGIAPLKGQLADIAKTASHADIAALMGKLLTDGSGIPFGFYVNNDAKNSSQYGVYLYQSGLTLPDRDYYLKDDPKFVANREAMREYVRNLMSAAGYPHADAAAANVANIELFIAQSQWSRVESRDANKAYNKMSLKELQQLMSGFDFDGFAKAAGLTGKTQDVIVRQPSYFEKLGAEFGKFPVSAWQDYLAFHLVDSYAGLLSQQFVDLHFDFHSKTLMGIQEQKPRWKRAVDGADQVIGELVGKEYVARHFQPEAKARMESMIKNLIKGFEVSIDELEWMTPETKKAAQEKLSKFTYKIGYPDKWKDYSNLEIKADDLVGNYQRYARFEYQDMLAKLGKPIDRSEWHMTPQTVNAYYNPVMNEIVFPAAILQPPFFNMEADDAVNYGGIGAVIGHEISHGFDDQGAKYDGDGNLRNWWTDKDREEFQKRGAQLSAQYSQFEALPGKFVNGDLTLGENIGDLGGLTVALRSYHLSLNGKEAPVMDGLTGDQRFFVGWSQVWRRNYRDEELGRRLLTDPHSPSHYRAMGTPRNVEGFYKAFDLKPTDKMYLSEEDRVKIW